MKVDLRSEEPILNREELEFKVKTIKFLADNNIYEEFLEELMAFNPNSSISKLIKYLQTNKRDINSLINVAFLWSETKRGQSYWAKVNVKYRIYMTKAKRKMTTEEIELKGKLVSFLEAKSAYGKFIKNLAQYKEWHASTTIDEYVQYLSRYGSFRGEEFEFAFDWAKTKEGKKYWSKMSDEFRKHLRHPKRPLAKEDSTPTIKEEMKPVVEVFAEKVN